MSIEVKKEKNILMTTMSKLNRIDMVNYYYSEKTENKNSLFCDGASSVEDGSKYILSQYPINEILVVGTPETLSEGDRIDVENLADYSFWQDIYKKWHEDYSHILDGQDCHKISAYEFYKLRIAEYLNQESVISSKIASASVSEPARRDKIEEIALEAVRNIEETGIDSSGNIGEVIAECMLLPEKIQKIMGEIKNKIEKNIEQAFQEEEGYLQYVSQKKEMFSKRIDIAMKNNEYQSLRKDILNDTSLSILEREFLLVSLSRKIDNLHYEKEKIHMEAEAARLRKENAELQYQIQNLKKQRAGKELGFAKYILYQHMDGSYKMKPYIDKPEEIFIRFVPEKTGKGFDNIAGIVNEIYSGEEMFINLYVDMQGGNRTSGYVRNAILSILNNQDTSHIQIKKIIATDFIPGKQSPSKIVDETNRYRVNDLVSGMNAFIRYGKADMLIKYCEDMQEKDDSKVRLLTDGMKEIDDAISLCNIQGLREGIGALSGIINSGQDEEPESYVSNIFRIMEDGIRRDYGKLLESTEIDYVDLVDWCQRKGLIQQALTIIEDKMPAVLLEKFIDIDVWKKDGNKKCDLTTEELVYILKAPRWEKRRENILFYRIIKVLGRNFCYKMFNKLCKAYFLQIDNQYEIDINKEVKQVLDIFFENNNDGNDDKVYEVINKLKKNDNVIKGFSDDKNCDRLKFNLYKHFINKYLNKGGTRMSSDLQKKFELNYIDKDYVLKQKDKLLDKYNNGKKIADSYCLFQEISNKYENNGDINQLLFDPCIYTEIFSSNKQEYFLNFVNGKPLKTIAGIKKQEYVIKNKTEIILKAEIKKNVKKVELEKLLILHETLKNERNNINHASDKVIRLPLKIIKKSVQEYIEKYKSLIAVI